MRIRPILTLLMAAGLGPALMAQEPHFGFGFNLSFPTGAFHRTTYPATSQVQAVQTEGYDLGVGGQFTASFPVHPNLAIRMDLAGQVTDGSNTAPGYDRINLRHRIFMLGGDVQVFPSPGSAYRHEGPYFLGGLSADFERFDRSFGKPNWDYTDTTTKSRLGGNVGLGYAFGYGGGGRFCLEGTFHKTLNGNDTAAGEPPSTDFAKLSFGWVF